MDLKLHPTKNFKKTAKKFQQTSFGEKIYSQFPILICLYGKKIYFLKL